MAFDICEDVTEDFYTKYGFSYPPTPTSGGFVVGPNKGPGCRFNAEQEYDVIIAMTNDPVGLGVASQYNKLVYEDYVINGRPAEIARVKNQSDWRYINSLSCELNVELPNHLITFYLSNSGFSDSPPEPCEKLTEIATDVVAMILSAK